MSAVVHIRLKPSDRNPLDPNALLVTLCGGTHCGLDMSYRETHFRKLFNLVTCEECRVLRFPEWAERVKP